MAVSVVLKIRLAQRDYSTQYHYKKAGTEGTVFTTRRSRNQILVLVLVVVVVLEAQWD